MGALKKTFVSGLLVTLPVLVTVFVLWWVFHFLDGVLGEIVEETLGLSIPGLGILVVLILIMAVGVLTRIYVGNKLLSWGDNLMSRIPLVRVIYISMRQLVQTLSGGNRAFRDVVVLEYPRRELFTLGFVTGYSAAMDGPTPTDLYQLSADAPRASGLAGARRMLRERRQNPEPELRSRESVSPRPPGDDDTLMHVFVPTTPNPTSGYLLLVPWRDVVFLDASVEDSVRFIISGGVLPLGEDSGQASARSPLYRAGDDH